MIHFALIIQDESVELSDKISLITSKRRNIEDNITNNENEIRILKCQEEKERFLVPLNFSE